MEYSLEEIKLKVSKEPLVAGGSTFENYILHQSSSTELKLRPSRTYAAYAALCALIVCIFVSIVILSYHYSDSLKFIWDYLYFVIFGFIFFVFLIMSILDLFKTSVFDKGKNRFYKRPYGHKVDILLSKIVAIQVIGEIVEDESTNFNSFELNLVLDNSKRINILDHSNLSGILQDAKQLSEFLDISIWHAKTK